MSYNNLGQLLCPYYYNHICIKNYVKSSKSGYISLKEGKWIPCSKGDEKQVCCEIKPPHFNTNTDRHYFVVNLPQGLQPKF